MNGIVSKAYVHATIALHSGWGNVRSEISADLGYQKSSLAGARHVVRALVVHSGRARAC